MIQALRPSSGTSPAHAAGAVYAGSVAPTSSLDFAVVWPGGDGYENSFGMDVAALRRRFAGGLAEALDAVPGVQIALIL